MKRSVSFLFFLACAVAVAPAARAESIFGMGLFGTPSDVTDARIAGRGGAGLAVEDSVNAAVMHAAQLADLTRVTIGLANTFERRTSEDAGGSITRNGLNTPVVRVGFPLFGRGGFGFGFSAYRSTQWTVIRPYESDPTTTETLDRSGTLFDIPVQLAWRFGDHVTVGAGLHLLRGNVRMEYELDLEDRAEIDPLDIREDIYSGTATEVSLALRDVGPVSLAGYFVPSYDADVEIRQRGIALNDRSSGERTDEMPARYGIGLRTSLGGDWIAAADYQVEAWSDYSGRGLTFGEDGAFDPEGAAVDLNDEVEYRFGLERQARPRGFGATAPLRLGAYWRQWHYPLNGNDVTEWGVTVGTGVVLRAGTARTDVSLGWSRIGGLDENGAQEDVIRVVLSISGSERWY